LRDAALPHRFDRRVAARVAGRGVSPRSFPLDGQLQLLDIGARYGLQSPFDEWESHLRPVLFEPELREYERLRTRYEDVYNVALSDVHGPRRLFVTKGPGKSSLYQPNVPLLAQFPNPERFEIVDTQQVETTTLDILYQSGRLSRADAMKIDVQGAELDILRGGRQLIADELLSLQLEVCFAELYVGHARFAAIDAFVESIGGMHLHDFSKEHWRYARGDYLDAKGRLVFGDALYFSDIDRIMAMRERESKLVKSAFLAMIYGFPDFSLHLLGASKLSTDGVRAAERFIERHCRRRFTIPGAAIRRQLKWLLALFPSDGKDGSVGARRRRGRLVW
jgi:FkbM family methyltransferase